MLLSDTVLRILETHSQRLLHIRVRNTCITVEKVHLTELARVLNVVQHLAHHERRDKLAVGAVSIEDAEDLHVSIDNGEEIVLVYRAKLAFLAGELNVFIVQDVSIFMRKIILNILTRHNCFVVKKHDFILHI